TDDVLLTAVALPKAAIAGTTANPVCPRAQFQLSGPAGMASYKWSITGNGSLVGATNQQTVTVRAGTNCAVTFNVSLTVANQLCTDATNAEFMVLDLVAP